uniref:Uncharacterized protein n=1 Tax=Trichinella nativa TaxID=6335 RepID=A0A0V1JV08_9BILA
MKGVQWSRHKGKLQHLISDAPGAQGTSQKEYERRLKGDHGSGLQDN